MKAKTPRPGLRKAAAHLAFLARLGCVLSAGLACIAENKLAFP